MDGAKPSFFPLPKFTPVLAPPRRRWLSMRRAAAVNANHGMIIGAVLWPPDYIALSNRHRHLEPAGRAAFDRRNVAHS
jgi:hypothetical protein